MNQSIFLKRFGLYAWAGLAYFFLGLFTVLPDHPGHFFTVALNNAWGVMYVVFINFVFFEYALPFVFTTKTKPVQLVSAAILISGFFFILYSYGSYIWRLLGAVLHIYTPLRIFPSLYATLVNQVVYSTGGFVLSGIVKHAYTYFKLQQSAQQLRLEKKEAELNYLKSQTNPHFLFNTLNNIYALSKEKSKLASESILRLSKILRFMLYETAGESIPIEQEIRIIRDYLALEQLRYDDTLQVSFINDTDHPSERVPPLLLMPLVENAFKHGVSETRTNPFVNIRLSIHNKRLLFEVQNSVSESLPENKLQESIGLGNLKRQLELLYSDHTLSLQHKGNSFVAVLQINLASHA